MKYGMLIVDDEYLVRRGVRETIDWQAIDVEIVGEATNGKQGLEAALRLRPDVIFTDIRMPVMDGLEMIEKLKEADYDGAIIIYNGYQDFEYARKALEFGVVTYLLKPFNNQDLVNKVREALAELEEKRKRSKIIGQYERNLPLLKEKLFQEMLKGPLTEELAKELAALSLLPPEKGLLIRGEGEAPEEALREVLSEIGSGAIAQVLDSEFVLITGELECGELSEKLDRLLLARQRQGRAKVFIQISSAYENREIHKAYEEALALSRNPLYRAAETVAAPDSSFHHYKQIVKGALQIISEEYDRKLTIREVAERLYVSESHLMHEFKENIGKTFNECLTEYRIRKAKELLARGNLRVNEVAFMVGYQDVKYFGQVFKEMVGMTPSQFLQKINEEV